MTTKRATKASKYGKCKKVLRKELWAQLLTHRKDWRKSVLISTFSVATEDSDQGSMLMNRQRSYFLRAGWVSNQKNYCKVSAIHVPQDFTIPMEQCLLCVSLSFSKTHYFITAILLCYYICIWGGGEVTNSLIGVFIARLLGSTASNDFVLSRYPALWVGFSNWGNFGVFFIIMNEYLNV